jgi:hypothetical protein
MIITATTGTETFSTGSAKSHIFVVPSRPGQKEVHIGIAGRQGGDVRLISQPSRIPCAPGYRPEMGEWTTGSYEVAENTVLKVFAYRSAASFGAMRTQANLLLRVRSQAAFLKIGTILTGAPNACLTRAWLEGRFDILTLDQARNMGLNIPATFGGSFDEVQARRAFEIVTMDSEIATAPRIEVQQVTNTQGEEVEIRVANRRRALDI